MGTLCGFTAALMIAAFVSRVDHARIPTIICSFGFFGLLTFLWYGGVDTLNHLVLRLTLNGRRELPFRSRPFFDHAVDCILLRRVGGGYVFVHRLLLEYFAGDASDKGGISSERTSYRAE